MEEQQHSMATKDLKSVVANNNPGCALKQGILDDDKVPFTIRETLDVTPRCSRSQVGWENNEVDVVSGFFFLKYS